MQYANTELHRISREAREDALAGLDPRDWRGSKEKVVYNDAAGWADACRQAMEILAIDPISPEELDEKLPAAICLQIEYLNGLRRMADPNGKAVADQLVLIGQVIERLSADNPRRPRLEELIRYHEAIVAGLIGDFNVSAKYQRQAAEKAEAESIKTADTAVVNLDEWRQALENDLPIEQFKAVDAELFRSSKRAYFNSLVAEYLAAREDLNDSLVTNDIRLQEFKRAVEALWKKCQRPTNDPIEADYRRRWGITVWINWQIYRLLIKQLQPGESLGVAWTLELPDEMEIPADLQATFAGSMRCYRALSALARGNYAEAASIAAEDIGDVQDPEWVALALLIRVQALRLQEKWVEAGQVLIQLDKMTWGCHVAQSIARQLGD